MFPDGFFAPSYFTPHYWPRNGGAGGALLGGINVHHVLPDWQSLASYKYSLADLKRRREDEEIIVLTND